MGLPRLQAGKQAAGAGGGLLMRAGRGGTRPTSARKPHAPGDPGTGAVGAGTEALGHGSELQVGRQRQASSVAGLHVPCWVEGCCGVEGGGSEAAARTVCLGSCLGSVCLRFRERLPPAAEAAAAARPVPLGTCAAAAVACWPKLASGCVSCCCSAGGAPWRWATADDARDGTLTRPGRAAAAAAAAVSAAAAPPPPSAAEAEAARSRGSCALERNVCGRSAGKRGAEGGAEQATTGLLVRAGASAF